MWFTADGFRELASPSSSDGRIVACRLVAFPISPSIRPLPTTMPARIPVLSRLAAGLVALSLLGLLVTAGWLRPAGAGHGTHTQLGLLQCGWVAAIGKPCPTCGMTTAFAHAAHGNIARSLAVQPMGAILAIAAAAGFWGCLHAAVFGSRVGSAAGGLLSPRVLWWIAGAAVAAWAYKWLTWPT